MAFIMLARVSMQDQSMSMKYWECYIKIRAMKYYFIIENLQAQVIQKIQHIRCVVKIILKNIITIWFIMG